MTITNDRPADVLDGTGHAADHEGRSARNGSAELPPRDQTTVLPAARTAAGQDQAARSRPLPRGWGSHEERRMMRLGAAAFLLLGVYAAVFVVLGTVVWT